MSDVISVVGHAAIDFLFDVEGIAKQNESYPIIDYQKFFGGGAANIVAAISVLGGNSQLISAVGDDFATSGYEEHLDGLGVDLSLLFRLKGEKGTAAYVYTDPSHNQSTYFYWGASAKLKELEPPELEFVHLATSEPNFNAKIAQKSKFVSFDPGQDLVMYTRENLEAILDKTDILFTNKHEIKRVCDMTESTFDDIRGKIGIVVVTYDAEGSKIFSDGAEYEIPAVPVRHLTRPAQEMRIVQVSFYHIPVDILWISAVRPELLLHHLQLSRSDARHAFLNGMTWSPGMKASSESSHLLMGNIYSIV
ncbi:MAG: carbohydrate kinase family protein [Halobacteriota archaeon]